MGVLLKADGTVQPIFPAEKIWSIDETKALLHDYMEMVHLTDGDVMLVAEDGHRLGFPVNTVATVLAFAYTGGAPIVGDVLLTDLRELGETDIIAQWGVSGSGIYSKLREGS